MAIPKDTIYKHKGAKNLKYFLVLAYLQKNLTLLGRVNLTIDNMITECGYVPERHVNKNNIVFKTIINELISKQYFSSDVDVNTIRNNQMFTLTMSKTKNIFHADSNFVLLTIEEFDKIVQAKTTTSKSVVWATYIYIKQFIIMDNNTESVFAKIGYPSKYGMQKKLGVSSKSTIEKAVKDLVDLKMLYEYTNMVYENEDGDFAPTNNVYALEEKELKYAEQTLCGYYKVDKIYKRNEIDKDKLKYPERN